MIFAHAISSVRHTDLMNLHRILAAVGGVALIAGLLLVFVMDGEAGWFTYAPISDGDSVAITGGTLVSNHEMIGFVLVALAVMLGSGLAGYRIGTRRRTGHE